MNKALRRPIRLKDGREFAKGEKFALVFSQSESGRDIVTATNDAGQSFKTPNFTIFFAPPSLAELEDWNNDGICESITGDTVEPDGHGPDGAPSWLLAMGMI
jgi:hypothetical protein